LTGSGRPIPQESSGPRHRLTGELPICFLARQVDRKRGSGSQARPDDRIKLIDQEVLYPLDIVLWNGCPSCSEHSENGANHQVRVAADGPEVFRDIATTDQKGPLWISIMIDQIDAVYRSADVASSYRAAGIPLDQPPEERPPFHERLPPQILAVEVQEIEGEEHKPVRRRVDSRSKGIEIGDAVLVLDDHLAIDQGRFAGQPGARLDHPPIGPRLIIAVAGKGADHAAIDDEQGAIDDEQGAIAVIFDLVNPALPGRRLRDKVREFRLDKAEGF
jgi:hypothetical protein